jgi:hypothetical protein
MVDINSFNHPVGRLTQRHVAASDPLSFERFDWIDKVDAAPIPLAFDFRAPRHRQMIQQVGQRVFGPIFGH